MRQSYPVLLAALVLMSGCSTTATLSEQMAGWQGSNVGDVYSAWGEPESSEAFGPDTVLIWRDRAPEMLQTGVAAEWTAPLVVCERMIAVDAAGRVTGWRWRGDACPALHTSSGYPLLVASH